MASDAPPRSEPGSRQTWWPECTGAWAKQQSATKLFAESLSFRCNCCGTVPIIYLKWTACTSTFIHLFKAHTIHHMEIQLFMHYWMLFKIYRASCANCAYFFKHLCRRCSILRGLGPATLRSPSLDGSTILALRWKKVLWVGLRLASQQSHGSADFRPRA